MYDQPIHRAAFRGDLAEVQRLFRKDPSLINLRGRNDETPLTLAARGGHAAIVEWLIDNAGANIEAHNIYENNGLHLSSWKGHLEVAWR